MQARNIIGSPDATSSREGSLGSALSRASVPYFLTFPNKNWILRIGFILWVLFCAPGSSGLYSATVGTVVPLLGQPNELAYDPTRKLLFVANTTQNRIEAYSLERGQWVAPIPVGRRPVGMAIIPESNLLLVCNTDETFLSVVDLVTLSQTGTIPVTARSFLAPEVPFSIALLSRSSALLSTNVGLQIVDIAARVTKPIPTTGFSIAPNTGLVSSGDGRYVLGQAGGLAFLYNPSLTQSLEQVRLVLGSALLASDPTGSRWMIGSAQFDRQLFQTAQINPFVTPFPVGGIAFSADGSSVFAGMNQSPGAEIQILAVADLKRLSSFRVPEPITGKMLASPDGNFLFAISLSGITVVDLRVLPGLPAMGISSRIVYFSLSACALAPQTRTVQITHSGGGTFTWKASTNLAGVTAEPSAGVGASVLKITLDPTGLNFRSTALLGSVRISSEESISRDQTLSLVLNFRSPDQIGTVFPTDGFLTDVLLDESRERVYLVNSTQNQIEVFSTARQEFLTPVPVGSIPKAIALSNDKKRLFVASLGTESIMVLDAETLTQTSLVRIPHLTESTASLPGTHPFSVAQASNGAVLVVAATLGASNRGTVYRWDLNASTALAFPRLGSEVNAVSGVTFLTASGDGTRVFLVDSGGNLYLYDSGAGDFVIARSFSGAVTGNVAASEDGSRFHAGNQLLNFVLVPQEIIPSGITGIPTSIAGFTFARSGTLAYRGVRPTLLSSGLPSPVAPRIEKLDTSAQKLLSGFNITEALAPNSASPALAILRQLAINNSETMLYGISDSGLMVIPLSDPSTSLAPQVSSGGVVNAASYAPAPSPVAPGSIAAIFGTNLSKGVFRPEGFPLPTLAGGVCVTFDGVPAPLFFGSPNQLNVQVPFELSGRSSASVAVSAEGSVSSPVPVNLSREAPGIFTLSDDGQGPGRILHSSDFSTVSFANPAKIGEVVSIYATGLGPTSPSLGTGLPAPDPTLGGLYQAATPSVTMGGAGAAVLFSGLAPNFVGLYQVDVRIPSNAPVGTNIPVVLRVGTQSSNPATIAIVPASPLGNRGPFQ